jgi:hypothetical protein
MTQDSKISTQGTKRFNDGLRAQCTACGLIKYYQDFNKKKGEPESQCRECRREKYRDYYQRNHEFVRSQSSIYKKENRLLIRIRKHGLTQEKYDALFNLHNGKCWICKVGPAAEIDHDHACCPGETGCDKCVRGLLCGPCNRMLGHADDRVEKLIAGAVYLKSTQALNILDVRGQTH